MMNSYELMGSKSSPLCHMFDSDRLLASDSNEDSDDHSAGASSADKYHTLDHLDSYDTITDLENHLMNGHSASLSGHQSHGLTTDHLHGQQQNSIGLSQHLMSGAAQNCLQNSQNSKRKGPTVETGAQNGAITAKRVPPANGKKTKGRVKIKMEFIDNKLRRYTTFSKRKTGIMKKAYELSTLTGTQVMLLVASETGHVYTFATRKLQPMITSDAGKALIQTCLNSPDPNSGLMSGDQRMSATGFEETDLTYAVGDESPNDKSCSSLSSPTSCMSQQSHSYASNASHGQSAGGMSHGGPQHSGQHNGLHALFDTGLTLDQLVNDGFIANCSSPTQRLPPFCTI